MRVQELENLIKKVKMAIEKEYAKGNVARAKKLKAQRVQLVIKLKQYLKT